jgi:hypothetical protein
VLGNGPAAQVRIDPEVSGVAFVDLGPALERFGLAHGRPSQKCLEAREAAIPAGCVPGGLGAIGKGVGEDEHATVTVGPKLEAKLVAVPRARQQAGRLALGHLQALARAGTSCSTRRDR